MMILSTKSCGLNEIHNLSTYGKKADKAMLAFCENQLESNNKFNTEVAYVKDAVCTHYFFSAAVRPEEIGKNGKVSADNYGEAFAKFIRDNDFGNVVETKPVINAAWHPDRSSKVWVWTPNITTLRTWYCQQRGERMRQRLIDCIAETRLKLEQAKTSLKRLDAGHYLRDHYNNLVTQYKGSLENAEQSLKDIENSTRKAE